MLLLHIQRRRPSPPWWGDESALPIDQGPEEEPFWLPPRPWAVSPPLLLFAPDEALPPVPDLDDKPPITLPRPWPLPWSPPLPFLWDRAEALPLAPPEEVPWTPLLTWPLAAPRSPPWPGALFAPDDALGTPPPAGVFTHAGSPTMTEIFTPVATIATTRPTVAAGQLIAVLVGWSDELGPATLTGVSDGTSAFTPGTLTMSGTAGAQWWYLLSSIATGSVTYTATFSADVHAPMIFSFAATVDGTPVLADEAVGTGDGGTTTPSSAALNIAAPDALVYGGFVTYGVATVMTLPLVAGLAADVTNPGTYTLAWGRVMTAPFTGAVSLTTDVPPGVWNVPGIAFTLAPEECFLDEGANPFALQVVAARGWASWARQSVWQDVDGLPPLPGFLDDLFASIPKPWSLAPVAWAAWGEDATLPIGPELDDGEEWVAPLLQGIPSAVLPLWVPDELPLAPPEDAPWLAVFPPWPATANAFPLFDVADALALAPPEDAPWAPVFPWPVLSLAILARTDDDVFPRVTFEEMDWQRPALWADAHPGLPWLTDDALPSLFIEDEDPWLVPVPWPTAAQLLSWPTDDVLPVATFDEIDWPLPRPWAVPSSGLSWLSDDSLPLVVLEESSWIAPTPWPALSVSLPWVVDDPLPMVSIEEEDQWVWLGPWPAQVPFPPWPVDDVLPIAALAFDVAAEWFWQPPLPWNEWRLPRAFSADDAPPPIIPPPVRDDVLWLRPVWWPEVPGRLGLWPEVNALPLAPPDVDAWRAPVPWGSGLPPVVWPVDDVLPPALPPVEDDSWRGAAVWPWPSIFPASWMFEDALPLAPPEDAAGWAVPVTWPSVPAMSFPWLMADELPRAVADAEGWSLPVVWPPLVARVVAWEQAGELPLPVAPPEPSAWALLLPWPSWSQGLFSLVSGDDTLPAVPLDTEESGWRLPQPWASGSTVLPVWEHDETLPTLIVSEDDGWVLPLPPWPLPIVASLWDDADVYPTPPALEVTDDEWLPPLPWPVWWQPQQFAQPDEVPAEFELPPVHAWLWEDVWLPPLPWDVPWPGYYQTHVPQDAPEALLVGVAWRTFDATCHDYTFTASCHDYTFTAPCHDFVFVGGGCVLQQFYKQPAENYLIAVDFSTAMPLGTTAVVSGTVSAMNVATGVDATATVLGSASAIVASPTVVHARVQAGDLTTYKLTFRVTFTPSAVLEEEIFMIVAET